MSQTIQAGFFADLSNLIKTISNTLFKFLDKVAAMGVSVSKPEKTEDGGAKVIMTINGEEAEITTTPVEGKKGIVNVIIIRKGGKKIEIKGVVEDNLDDEIVSALEELKFDVSFLVKEKRADASKRLQVKLHRIDANDCVNIELTAIDANYNAAEAAMSLNYVLSDDKFINTLTGDPQSFEIIDTESELDVNPIQEFDISYTCHTMLYAAIALWCNLKTIHWNASGADFFTLHEKLDEYIDEIEDEIDVLGELCAELTESAPNPGNIPEMFNLIPAQPFDIKAGLCEAKSNINEYVVTISAYYVNFSSDIQGTIDEFIRYWKKESDYKLTRVENIFCGDTDVT